MNTHICLVCGHVYDPGKGEPTQGIHSGTAFIDLPSDWRCPVCGASSDKFKEA